MISTKYKISIGNKVYQPQMFTSILNDVINAIKIDVSLKLKVKAIRSCDDKDEYKETQRRVTILYPYCIRKLC